MRAGHVTFTIIFREHWQLITWISSVLIIASDGVTGAMHGEIIMFLITVMLMMMGSGAILPWSVRWQGSFNIFCVLAWSAMRLNLGGNDPEQAAEWVGVLCAARNCAGDNRDARTLRSGTRPS